MFALMLIIFFVLSMLNFLFFISVTLLFDLFFCKSVEFNFESFELLLLFVSKISLLLSNEIVLNFVILDFLYSLKKYNLFLIIKKNKYLLCLLKLFAFTIMLFWLNSNLLTGFRFSSFTRILLSSSNAVSDSNKASV